MKTTLHLSEGSNYPKNLLFEDIAHPESLAPFAENPDARIFLTAHNGCTIGHLAIWWQDTPTLDGKRIGAIGGFAANDFHAASQMLDCALDYLKKAGCELAVGPMNRNTWHRHRFVTESDQRGRFMLEPRNPSEYPNWWMQSGFHTCSTYSSSVIQLNKIEATSSALAKRLERSGVIVRELDISRYDDELRAIYSVSLKSFTHNFLYTPLSEEGFLDAYRKVRERVGPDFVKIAERDGVTCGFVFGIPDFEALARGEKPSVIVKTLAVDPLSHCAGLGSLLVEKLHRAARIKGYDEAIHALQHETNTSLKITGRHHGNVFRRYSLFSKQL